MSLKLCTWNSQGDPTTDSRKLELLKRLYSTSDVLLLQECGDLKNLKKIEVVYPVHRIKTPQVGAYNDRCTTAILSKERPVEESEAILPSGTGRSLVAARFDSLQFAVMTMHGKSGTGADVWPAICQQESFFILGGDLNCTPDELRGRHPCDFNNSNGRFVISAPSSATHSHSVLDYFIHTKGIICKNTKIADSSGGSDHYPVLTEAYIA